MISDLLVVEKSLDILLHSLDKASQRSRQEGEAAEPVTWTRYVELHGCIAELNMRVISNCIQRHGMLYTYITLLCWQPGH